MPQSRERYWITAFRCSNCPQPHQLDKDFSSEDLPLWYHQACSTLVELQIDTLPLSSFLLPNDDSRLRRWQQVAQTKSGDTRGKETTWEVDHIQAFEQSELPWPPEPLLLVDLKRSKRRPKRN